MTIKELEQMLTKLYPEKKIKIKKNLKKNKNYLKSTFDNKQGALSGLVKEHLHIDKVQSIDEVLDTPEWKNFYKVITKDKITNETPEVCIRHCGQGMRSIRVKEND